MYYNFDKVFKIHLFVVNVHECSACMDVKSNICLLCLQNIEEAVDNLEWHLWIVVSQHLDAGDVTQVTCKSSKCS